jgi:Arc/MetJ-type ribon-helix-helix transcriptional regulator
VTIELKPEQEQIIRQQLASGLYGSVEEVLDTALASLPNDARFDREHRREAVRRMIEFAERRKVRLGEPVTRQLLHEGHRI